MRSATSQDKTVARVAVVGTGVIGVSWTALFLAHGLDVSATDPAPGAEARLRQGVRAHWPALQRLGLAGDASVNRLTFTPDLTEAVAEVEFVQESGPEREGLKQQLFRDLDAAAAPSVLLASSSSGLLPSRIQESCEHHPERVLIGHPFNPPHLVPLVEVVGGEQTSDSVIERAIGFYTAMGRRPIRLRRELPGYIANRLQAALWREAYSLVERGVATVTDIDTAISQGPGLRWALLGPFVNQHLSGGAGGLAHVLEHLGPSTEALWADLGTPRMTPELAAALVAGVQDELATVDSAAMMVEWDSLLIELLNAKAAADALP